MGPQPPRTVVVGAGVIGLAIARELARTGDEVYVLEAEGAIGTGVTSRNSEVVHAGLYYPPGSRKARSCVRGRDLLYAYAEQRGVAHRRIGKLVVATHESEIDGLLAIRDRARANGAGTLEWLDGPQVREREPALRAVAALWSPQSGIVDSHGLTHALAADVEAAGGAVVLHTRVVDLRVQSSQLVVISGDEPTAVTADRVVLAAGFGSLPLARCLLPSALLPPTPRRWAKGTYHALVGCPPPFRHLVYPLPEPGGLGIHATVDLAGQVRFGPDVEWVERPDDHAPSAHGTERCAAAVRRYWPGLPEDALQPSYAGVRPKIVGPGEPPADFELLDPSDHGIPGLVVLLGIESPGLTAALALAEEVGSRLANA